MELMQQRIRLFSDDLKVEAGFTVETTIVVGPADAIPPDGFQDYRVVLHGLPERWYSLSATSLRVPAGEVREVLLVIHPPHEDRAAPLGMYEFEVELVPEPEGERSRAGGRVRVLAPGAIALQSRLLQYLPNVLRGDPFLARFLLIFQSITDPIEHSISATHHYLDPRLTPSEFLDWLASWLDLTLDPGLDERAKRELITRAVELYRWKGTRRALREELQIRTGGRPLVVENFDGLRIGQDAALGLNTHLGARREQCITVTLAQLGGRSIDPQQANALVEELKPAHVGSVVRIVSAPSSLRGDGHG